MKSIARSLRHLFLFVLALGWLPTAQSAVSQDFVATPESLAETWAGVLRRPYAQRQNSPLWFSQNRLNANGQTLIEALRQADRWGLNPREYPTEAIVKRLQSSDPKMLVEADPWLSAVFLTLADHLHRGRVDPAKADPDWFLPRPTFQPEPLLSAIARGKGVMELLESVQPVHRGYRNLLKGLHQFQALAAQGGWSEIPKGSKLIPAMTDERVPAIRERLKITGEMAATEPAPPLVGEDQPAGDPLLYDEGLAEAVRRFQGRYGLEADAIIGPGTLAAFNRSARERVHQIALNLERWRWLPRSLGDRYILVNMAGYELTVVEQDEPLWDMRVIVGQIYRKTPAFSQRMTEIVLNPYWNVPDRIAHEDLLPKLRKKPNFLKDQGIQILGGTRKHHASAEDTGEDPDAEEPRSPIRLRQSPGPKNALGRIKFLLPNRFAIYLHDTPKRQLFNKTIRTFSSGCIRLEKPIKLAGFVLQGTSGWDAARVQAGIDSGKTVNIRLAKPVPVFMVYLTTWLDAGGVMQFRPDVYQRDQRLRQTLFASAH
ncbi:MAG: L,D-transpeptidase family protein [Pseudomonadota bacterium]